MLFEEQLPNPYQPTVLDIPRYSSRRVGRVIGAYRTGIPRGTGNAVRAVVAAGTLGQCCSEGGGVGSKNYRRAGRRFFEPGGYKIEPLLIKQ